LGVLPSSAWIREDSAAGKFEENKDIMNDFPKIFNVTPSPWSGRGHENRSKYARTHPRVLDSISAGILVLCNERVPFLGVSSNRGQH
jgi:hypothetical protein